MENENKKKARAEAREAAREARRKAFEEARRKKVKGPGEGEAEDGNSGKPKDLMGTWKKIFLYGKIPFRCWSSR